MRDPLRLTLLCWETRNWRHHKRASEWCKNYGLIALTKFVYVGNLSSKERERIGNYFTNMFKAKTEKYYLFSLYGSTIEGIIDKEGSTKRMEIEGSAFEIV